VHVVVADRARADTGEPGEEPGEPGDGLGFPMAIAVRTLSGMTLAASSSSTAMPCRATTWGSASPSPAR